ISHVCDASHLRQFFVERLPPCPCRNQHVSGVRPDGPFLTTSRSGVKARGPILWATRLFSFRKASTCRFAQLAGSCAPNNYRRCPSTQLLSFHCAHKSESSPGPRRRIRRLERDSLVC